MQSDSKVGANVSTIIEVDGAWRETKQSHELSIFAERPQSSDIQRNVFGKRQKACQWLERPKRKRQSSESPSAHNDQE